MEIAELVEHIEKNEKLYRKGKPKLTDSAFDALISELKQRDPEHPLLDTIGVEEIPFRKKVKHHKKMLSVQKAYGQLEIYEHCQRILKHAKSKAGYADINDVFVDITPKLDGVAAEIYNKVVSTRGDGEYGFDITRLLKGQPALKRNNVGELVVSKQYFEDNLRGTYSHPRSVSAAIVNSRELNPTLQKVLDDNALRFVVHKSMPTITIPLTTLPERFTQIYHSLTQQCPYPTDGIVVRPCDQELIDSMGSTKSHMRAIFAIKTNLDETTVVTGIKWSVSPTGTITPVIVVEPVRLSGAVISNVSGHNVGWAIEKGVGVGASVKIARGGQVIPKITEVIKSVPVIPIKKCPTCGSNTKIIESVVSPNGKPRIVKKKLICPKCANKFDNLKAQTMQRTKKKFVPRKS